TVPSHKLKTSSHDMTEESLDTVTQVALQKIEKGNASSTEPNLNNSVSDLISLKIKEKEKIHSMINSSIPLEKMYDFIIKANNPYVDEEIIKWINEKENPSQLLLGYKTIINYQLKKYEEVIKDCENCLNLGSVTIIALLKLCSYVKLYFSSE